MRVLAGGIAHEFNNILAAIMGFSEISLLKLPPELTRIRDNLENVLQASRRGAELVRHLLAFCRQADTGFHHLEVQALLKEMARLLRSALPASLAINTNFLAEGRTVEANLDRMHRMVLVLCTRAVRDLGQAGGVLEIGLEPARPDLDRDRQWPGLAEKPCLRLWIASRRPDSGQGEAGPGREWPDPDLDQATGIAREHGGDLRSGPCPQGGHWVEIFLPCSAQVSGTDGPAKAEASRLRRIMVVDDEAVLALAMTEMLEGLGYGVTACTHPLKALQILSADPGAFDLVITDQLMPSLSGSSLCREIKSLRPDIPVLLFTGQEEDTPASQDPQFQGVLRKPLLLSELAQAVEQALSPEAAHEAGPWPKC